MPYNTLTAIVRDPLMHSQYPCVTIGWARINDANVFLVLLKNAFDNFDGFTCEVA